MPMLAVADGSAESMQLAEAAASDVLSTDVAVWSRGGPRKAETEEFLKRADIIDKESVCLQSTHMGDFAVIYIEGTDPKSVPPRLLER